MTMRMIIITKTKVEARFVITLLYEKFLSVHSPNDQLLTAASSRHKLLKLTDYDCRGNHFLNLKHAL